MDFTQPTFLVTSTETSSRNTFINRCMLRFIDGDNSSTHRAVALATLIVCCTCGTPLTLICTIPGYIMADTVSIA